MTIEIQSLLPQIMRMMAEVAEEIPMKAYRGDGDIPVVWKPDGTPVTDADSATEYRLIERLTHLLPGSQVLGEETAGAGDAWKNSPLLLSKADVWIVDPIDGTHYFYRKQPFGMLIGLRRGGEMKMAVAYYPVEQEFLWASQETPGAFHCVIENGIISEPVLVAMPKPAIGKLDLGYYVGAGEGRKIDEILDPAVVTKFHGAQVSLCVATALRRMLMTGYACLYNGYKPWDFEATALIARQAGAVVTHFDGTESHTTPTAHNVIFASTREIAVVIHRGIRACAL